MISVLRISSTSFDVDAFAKAHPEVNPIARWKSGDTRPVGGPFKDSGMNMDIAEASTWVSLLERTLAGLRALSSALEAARGAGASAAIDFAIDVGTDEHFARSVTFGSADLACLCGLGIDVTVTVYPVPDGAE